MANNKRRLLLLCLAVLFLSSSSLFFFSEGFSEEEDGTVFAPAMKSTTVEEESSDLDETFRENPETLSQLFDWAIQNSDRETLRSMAEEMRKRETLLGDGDDDDFDDTKEKKNIVRKKKWTSEELLEKAKNVREMLDQMAMHPSEVEILKEIVEIFTDGSLDARDRVRALERLDDMVAQIDLAFDFHTILGLKPLLMVVENEGEVTEVRAQACQVFATLTSNYEKIQEIAADEFNAVSVLLNATSLAFEKKDEVVAKKCLFALT